jgi:hypothetical protein
MHSSLAIVTSQLTSCQLSAAVSPCRGLLLRFLHSLFLPSLNVVPCRLPLRLSLSFSLFSAASPLSAFLKTFRITTCQSGSLEASKMSGWMRFVKQRLQVGLRSRSPVSGARRRIVCSFPVKASLCLTLGDTNIRSLREASCCRTLRNKWRVPLSVSISHPRRRFFKLCIVSQRCVAYFLLC